MALWEGKSQKASFRMRSYRDYHLLMSVVTISHQRAAHRTSGGVKSRPCLNHLVP